MTYQHIEILSIISLTLLCFIWGKWRFDIIAMCALLICVVLGIISPSEAFSGFSHPATITVIFVLIISHCLTQSGALEYMSLMIEPTAKYPLIHLLCLMMIGAVFSMFMNNVGALALLMPIAIESTIKANRSPSMVLMPLSFATLLGGLSTLIGTPPNIIISSYRGETFGTSFNMFDFTPVGGSIMLGGLIFLTFFSHYLIPMRDKKNHHSNTFEIESYLFEIKIPEGTSIENTALTELDTLIDEFDIVIISLIRHNRTYYTLPADQVVEVNDILLIEGAPENIDKFITKFNLKIMGQETPVAISDVLHSKHTSTIEVVVSPMSELEGRKIEQVQFQRYHGVNLLGISRQGAPYRGRIRSFIIKAGDVLLLHGEKEVLAKTITRLKCLPLAKRGVGFGRRLFAFKSLLIFIFAIAISSLGYLPIHITLGCAILIMVLSRILPLKELYQVVNWPVVILLGAMLPIGQAFEHSGTSEFLVLKLLTYARDLDPFILLIGLTVVTMAVSDILNNAATAILMAPVGKILAEQTHSNPDTFLMAVAIGASCAFLTPIGHQNNALVLGPGKYQFSDYWKLGLPLQIVIIAIMIPAMLYFWPLAP